MTTWEGKKIGVGLQVGLQSGVTKKGKWGYKVGCYEVVSEGGEIYAILIVAYVIAVSCI